MGSREGGMQWGCVCGGGGGERGSVQAARLWWRRFSNIGPADQGGYRKGCATMAPPSRWELFGTAVKQLALSLSVDFSFVLRLSSPVPRLFGIGRVLPDMTEIQKRHIQKLEQQIQKGLRPALDPQTYL